MGQSTKIMGGSLRAEFRIGHISRVAVQPLPLYKSNVDKSKMAASFFYMLQANWHKWIYSSIQVQLFGCG